MSAVRKATAADVPRLAGTLARAFQDDPAFGWAVPDEVRRERFGRPYFEKVVGQAYLPKGEVHITEDGAAAAVWAPPGKWRTSPAESLRLLPFLARTTRSNLPLVLKMLATMERRHKVQEEPHYYLAFVGTDPDHWGKGHGTALLTAMLSRCDEEGVPAYLESTSLRNQALYHRHGFKVLDEMTWPQGGPPWWPMWRDPRPA